jgi:hypothetical protein
MQVTPVTPNGTLHPIVEKKVELTEERTHRTSTMSDAFIVMLDPPKPVLGEGYTFDSAAYAPDQKMVWFEKNPTTPRTTDTTAATGRPVGPKAEAKEYARRLGRGIPVISLQLSAKGARKFGVMPWASFYAMYASKAPEQRCFYEVVQEDMPCRLHADVDAELIGDAADAREKMEVKVRLFIEEASKMLYELVQVRVTDCFVLDACQGQKFSKHLVFHLQDGILFKAHRDLKNFIDFFYASKRAQGDERFWFCDAEAGEKFLLDLCIYKGDREFRLAFSTKKDKARWLLFDHLYKVHYTTTHLPPEFPVVVTVTLTEPQIPPTWHGDGALCAVPSLFGDTLVYYIPRGTTVRSFITCHWQRNAIPPAVIALMNKGERRNYLKNCGSDVSPVLTGVSFGATERPAVTEDGYDSYDDGMHDVDDTDDIRAERHELFARISRNIEKKLNMTARNDVVTPMHYYPTRGFCVSFSSTSKYCQLKGAEHGSNHIYFVAWLESKCFYQRCWNEQCKRKALVMSPVNVGHGTLGTAGDGGEDLGVDPSVCTGASRPLSTGGQRTLLDYWQPQTAKAPTNIFDEELWMDINAFLAKERERLAMLPQDERALLSDLALPFSTDLVEKDLAQPAVLTNTSLQ